MKFKSFAVAAAAFLLLAGCSTAQYDNFNNAVNNFVRGVRAVDNAVAKINKTLHKNCEEIQAIAAAAATLPSSCSKADLVVGSANAGLANYCQANNVSNVASAIVSTAAAVKAAKADYADAKASCRR
jgi:hypothetical protein